MAASLAKDLRVELEQMMDKQMKAMLLVLEERLAKAVAEGNILSNGKLQDPAQASLMPSVGISVEGASGYQSLVEPVEDSCGHEAPLSVREFRASPRDIQYQALPETEDNEVPGAHKDKVFVLNVVTIFMLAINSLVDIIDVDFQARQSSDKFPTWYRPAQLLLCFFFVGELVRRVSLLGWMRFFAISPRWHVFQVILVGFQVWEIVIMVRETWLDFPGPSTKNSNALFRFVSVIRIIRMLDIFDQLDFTTELHLLLASLHGSLCSLGWAAFFIVIPTFVFGMVLTQIVAEFRVNSGLDQSKLADLIHYFGTLDRSMMSLFWCIAGGLSWSEAMIPLRDFGFFWTTVVFVAYVGCMIFAVLNVLTGVFVNSATAAAASERERTMLATLHKIFAEVDYDKSGNLTHTEFQALLKHKDIKVCLQSLDIRPAQANHLFSLIDSNRSGVVEIDEFLKGCDRLQGNLRAIDFATFTAEFQGLRDETAELKQYLATTEADPPFELPQDEPQADKPQRRISCLPAFKYS
jgi:hypothetical protein